MQATMNKSAGVRRAAAGAPSRPSAHASRARLLVTRFKWPGSEEAAKPVPENEPLLAPGDEPVNQRQGDKGLHGAYDAPVVDYKETQVTKGSTPSKGFAQIGQQQKQQKQAPVPDNEVLLSQADRVQGQGGKGLQGANKEYGLPVMDYANKGTSGTSSQPITTGTAADYTTGGSTNSSYSNSSQYSSQYNTQDNTQYYDADEFYQRISSGLRDAWDNTQDKPQVALYAGVAVLTLWLSSRLVDAVESVPLLPGTLKFVGFVYTANFFYKYVLFASGRERLRNEIQDVVDNIETRRDELAAAASDTVHDEQAKAQRRAAAGPAELRRQAASAANNDSSDNGSNSGLEAAVKADVGIPTQTQATLPARLNTEAVRGAARSTQGGEGASVRDLE